MMTLFERTKLESEKQKLSLIEVANKAGIGENAIYTWKKSTPKADTLSKVANVLHVSTDYLLGRTDDMNNPIVEKNSHIDLKDALNDEIMLAFDGHEIPDEDKVKIREYIELLDLKRRSEHE
ncbi:helix-turn-helix domain-containing protein [Leuconostoc lactis]|uniref:helix-turn-helix domain-containing protein n=1 Tax=Leuconostoc lactis TaxID=1246 RepID=UPI003C12C163